ncbi:MAG: hypothetical protein DRO11_04795 [Methanobacteriota archaeon]|nr:MAG: hypothetical protein DRO11_04795 [Euryarchaeota archaeon]
MSVDLVASLVFAGCIAIYAAGLYFGLHHPTHSRRGLVNIWYARWVKHRVVEEDKLLAVHTLRNLIQAVTFLASTMLITLSVMIGNMGIFSPHPVVSLTTFKVSDVKYYLIFFIIIFSFLCFLMSLRMFIRLSVLINVDISGLGDKNVDVEYLQLNFVEAMNRLTYGLRAIYYLIATITWFISPYLFMGTTVLITLYLFLYSDIGLVAKAVPTSVP